MPTLFLVPVPLGDPGDLSPRAARVLSSVDVVAAENPDRARQLAAAVGFDLPARVVPLLDSRSATLAEVVLELLAQGLNVALVSDAGSPLIADPGIRLVQGALEAGVDVQPLPGPNAALTALTASGLPAHRFVFLGFPSRTPGKRRRTLLRYADLPDTLILYEAPKRLVSLLQDMLELWGDRECCLARDLTQPSQLLWYGRVSEAMDWLEGLGKPRGEWVIVVAGA